MNGLQVSLHNRVFKMNAHLARVSLSQYYYVFA